MKKNKKLLFTLALGGIATAITIPAVLTSCGDQNENKPVAKPNILANIESAKPELLDKITDAARKNKAIVITDAGRIDDKSFNQSAWEGLELFGHDTKMLNKNINYIEPSSQNDYDQSYRSIQSQGYKYWICVGFHHEPHIKKYYNDHKAELEKAGVIIIAVDFDASTPSYNREHTKILSPAIPQGYGITLKFDTKESGWEAGYASADFLSSRGDQNSRYVSSFGGGAFPGVTDFIEGYLKGINYWNSKNPDKKTKFVEFSKTNKVSLDCGFDATNDKMKTLVKQIVKGNGEHQPSIILPVAGQATLVVVDNMNPDQYVIGVDVDQTNAVKKNKDRFLTSITKGVGQAVYDVLLGLYSNNPDYLYGFEFGKKNGFNEGTIKENWTGLAKASLGTETKKGQKILDEAQKEFEKLTLEQVQFINSSKASENGEDVNDIPTRLNDLVTLINN